MASPAPRFFVFPPNPLLPRILGQRGPLGRGVRAKLLRCSAWWGIPFGPQSRADAIRTLSFVALRDLAERPVRWRLPPELAALFAEAEDAVRAEKRAEPHAQRAEPSRPGGVGGRKPESAAEPHAQRAEPSRPDGAGGRKPEIVAEPHAQRAGAAQPGGAGGRKPEIAAEPHAQRTEAAQPGGVDGRKLESTAEPHAQRTEAAQPGGVDGRKLESTAEPHAQRAGAAQPGGAGGRKPEIATEPHAQRAEPSRPGGVGGRKPEIVAEPHAQRYGNGDPAEPQGLDARPLPPSPSRKGRGSSCTTTNRGWLKNGAAPGDFLAALRCGARTRAGHPCRQPAMANGRCRLHGGLSTGPRTAAGIERIRAARTVHGAYAAPQRAQLQPLRSFVRESQIFYDLWRLEDALPPAARARLPAAPPPFPTPAQTVPSRTQARASAAAEAARLAPWRLAIQAAQAQCRDGAAPPELLHAVDQAFAGLPPHPAAWRGAPLRDSPRPPGPR